MKIERTESGNYRTRISYYANGIRRMKSITCATKQEVMIKANEEMAKHSEHSEPLTVKDCIQSYIDSKDNVLSPATTTAYRSYLKNHFSAIELKNIYSLTNATIQSWVNDISCRNSPKLVRNVYGLLSAALNLSRPDLTLNITLPKKTKHVAKIPTEEEINIILNDARGKEVEKAICLACYQGMRLGEISALKWSNVDFKKKTIKICENTVKTDKGYKTKSPKSAAGNRTIKLLPNVEKVLKESDMSSEYVVNLRSESIRNAYLRTLDRVGLDYTFHELRHYACSVMIMLGIPNKYIADFLGHEGTKMVETVYGHIMQDKKDAFFEKLSEYYA